MELINATRMQAGYTMGLRPDGRELLVVVVKGTFSIPESGQEPVLAATQAPLVDADVFTGEPGFSAPLYECDWAPAKPRCDVLLNGSAYAPGGKPVKHLTAALQVGRMHKEFKVVGRRVWKRGLFGARASWPEPFTVMPISYDNAFGGVDNLHKNPQKHVTHLSNFAGKGFYPQSTIGKFRGKPLPNTEELGHPVKRPGGKYRPMAFGAIGRAWQPRPQCAGTYDQAWIDNTFPFLPPDFDDRYYQAAPPDQQMDYISGGEEVKLLNLTPQGRVTFRLPRIEVPLAFVPRDGEDIAMSAICDTILIEPDLNRFILVWRAALPLRRNLFEIEQVIAGRMPMAWYRARESGKTYYASLQEFIASRESEEDLAGAVDDSEEDGNEEDEIEIGMELSR